MVATNLLFDVLLLVALLTTAGSALASTDLFRAVAFFIAFGLLMALAWVRLQAPDLAMAEAAIGAGLSGVLLLQTAMLGPEGRVSAGPPLRGGAMALCLTLAALLAWAVLSAAVPSPRLATELQAALPASGVSHPLTAVLLNFRGYDTFLETAVLTVVALICLALQSEAAVPAPYTVRSRLLDALLIWLAPVMVLLAVYLVWAGSKEPGGAFQAGALLAATGVLLHLSGRPAPLLQRGAALHALLAAGLATFLLAGLSGPVIGRPLFSFAAAHAGTIIFLVEAVLALSLGVILLSLVTGSTPPAEAGNEH